MSKGWIALSEQKKKWKKPILRVGEFIKQSQGIKFSIEQKHLDYFCSSFTKRIPVPLEHTFDPEKNRGWVTEVESKDNVLYAVFEFAEAIEDPSIYDTSVYFEVEEGYVRPLKHVALTSYPVIDGLGDFKAVACSLNPTKEDTTVPFDFSALKMALNLSEELTEENVVEKVSAAFSAARKTESPKIDITEIKEKYGKVLKLAKEGREMKIRSLPLSKGAQDALIKALCTEDVIALSLSDDYQDNFDTVIDAIKLHDGSIEEGERSGAQLPDSKKGKQKELSLSEMAQERAKAFAEGRTF
jgi:phage I-like protein